MEFAESTKMYVMNTFYKKKPGRKCTWRSPTGVKNEIDFFLSNNKSIFQDACALKQLNTDSDHRIIKARIAFNFRLERAKLFKTPKMYLKETMKAQRH